MKRTLVIAAAAVCALVCGILFFCGGVNVPLTLAQDSALPSLSAGTWCVDTLGYELCENNEEKVFEPVVVQTTVFCAQGLSGAVCPQSWEELFACDENVALESGNDSWQRLRLAMVFAGATRACGSTDAMLDAFKTLVSQGRIVFLNPNDSLAVAEFHGVFLTTDLLAARLFGGSDTKVPADGAVSVSTGVLCSAAQADSVDVDAAALVAAGFRLSDGECDGALYPAAEQYRNVVPARAEPQWQKIFDRACYWYFRTIVGNHVIRPADSAERLLMLLVCAVGFALWSGTFYFRVTTKQARQKLLYIAALCVCWMLLRAVKLLVISVVVERYLWYAFYIPMPLIPALFLSACRDITGTNRQNATFERALFAGSALLSLLVMSNDLHRLAFAFPGADQQTWGDYYVHGPVYYAVAVWMFVLTIGGLFLLLRYGLRVKNRAACLPPLALLAIMVFITIGYNLRIAEIRTMDISAVICTAVFVFIELCLRVNLIPGNKGYLELMRGTSVPVYLISGRFCPVLCSDAAKDDSGAATQLARELSLEPRNSSQTLAGGASVLQAAALSNGSGYVVWKTDISTVVALRTELSRNNEELKRKNQALQQEHNFRKEFYELRFRSELYTLIDAEIGAQLKRISALADTIPDSGAVSDNGTAALAQIKYLIGYCKRMSSLMLSYAEHSSVPAASLSLLLHETAADANAAGNECAVLFEIENSLSRETAIAIYDIVCHAIESSMMYDGVFLLVNVHAEHECICLAVNIETSGNRLPLVTDFAPDEKTCAAIKALGARQYALRDGESVSLRIEFPAKEAGDGFSV